MNICAPATASGGAIGIVRVSGPDAIIIVDKIFTKPIADAPGYTMHYGQIVNSDTETRETIDDVIVSVCRAPHSYTGEDTVEISHHGSSYIQQCILQELINHGCRMATPGEYTRRAFLNGKMDLSQAEAVADLIASQNASSHRIAMTQMRGGVSRKLVELRDQLLQMTSLLELELDFSEEDVEFADRQQLLNLANLILSEITHLSNSFSTGNAIKNGIPVAIIGAPNVGKSTLLNQLLREERAIVSQIQGTTRDIIEDTFTLSGTTFRFIDTAGIRATDDTIEKLGIQRSLQAAQKAHIILLMTEPGVPYPEITFTPEQHVIRILNKTDQFQAINGTGLPWLESELLKCTPTVGHDEVLVTNVRHKQALDLAAKDIQQAIQSLTSSLSGDLISEDLRLCLHHLAEIVGGEITTDEVLGNIFSHFCIGK